MRFKLLVGMVVAVLGLTCMTTVASAYCAYVTLGGNGTYVCTP
jgi:hypothetical protein